MTPTAPASRSPLPLVSAASDLGRNIDYELFMDCVHCGLCLGSCPTYVETGNENDSPRGRIYLWRAVTDGRAELTPQVREHLDLCLECKACETACPSGVQYGAIISSYKRDMERLGKSYPTLGWIQRWALFTLTPYANRMRWALAPLRLAQRLGLRGLIDGMSRWLPRSLRSMQEIVPHLAPHHGRLPELLPAEGKKRARVMLLVGCAADAFYPQTTMATARVLQKNGCEVLIPRSQGCCGALHFHGGKVREGQALAAQNCQAIASELDSIDAIITNAGGCGPVLKEYNHLLEGTPAADLGVRFAAKVRDIHEFLVTLGPVPPTHPLPIRATYHDACGLSHGQKIRSQPRQLLGLIPELKLVPLAESEHCCGAAGSYNITQPDMSHEIGLRKARYIAETGAQAVFTGNVGCLLQIARNLREVRAGMWVAHPIEALWASYSGEMPPELKR
ncbi:MAG: (Fe-S)-binding protein [Gemmataceae bacterium]